MTGTVLLTALIFLAALLYSSVGHGGASGYLAAMALFGLAPAVMAPMLRFLGLLLFKALSASSAYSAVKFSSSGIREIRVV